MSTDARSARVDVPTVIAISALAYTLANIVHEGLGHGGACVLVGARPTALNAIFFEYDELAATLVQQRWISAGGSIANVLVGLPILRVLRREGLPSSLRYFLWLFAGVNLLTAFGYLLYAAFGGTSLLAWYPGIPRTAAGGTPAVPLAIERSWAWIAAGAIVLTFFVVVLGPGRRLG